MPERAKLPALLSACALFAAASAEGADPGSDLSPSPAPLQAAAAPPRKPLMAGLDALGLAKPMDDLRLNAFGYVQAGYFYDFSAKDHDDGPTFIGYNSFKNTLTLNKADLNLERTVDPTQKRFDWGFRLEGLYGADAPFIHSNGLFDDQSSGKYQWDLLQAYVDVTLPGMPVRVRAGKWIELAGFEQFSAQIYGAFGDPARHFYTYSYQFLFAEPGTQTGVLATYVLSPQWSFDAGVTLGWNQSLEDTNDSIDFLGRVTWLPSDKTAVIFVTTIGPEFSPAVGPAAPEGDDEDWWVALDLVFTHKVTDKLSVGLGFDYVYAEGLPGLRGGQQWGGVAGYAGYAIDKRFTLNGRVEWYRDDAGGFSTGTPFEANYYEATLGLAIRPAPDDALLSNLLLRPEIRYDHSDKDAFDGGEDDQWTFSVDVVFQF